MADGEKAATAYTIGWEPQPGPQTALLACPVFEVFFGGARGGGKTDGMLGEWASHADLHGKNAVGLMVRRERVQLLETIERSRQIYGPIGARYNDQDKMWRWPNGARLRFAYLERDADADAYQGHSYTRVYVEELGTFPSASPVLRLMATLRSGEGVPCGFRATGNPGGPGHQWVKARYIDPNPAGWEIRKFTYENPWTRETIEQDRVFIPSKLRDNKFLGPEYVANLQMVGSDTLVRAWLEGDWTVIEGAYFDCWRYEQHVVEPFEVPAHWARFRSMDWGSAKPFSVGWWAIVSDDYYVPRAEGGPDRLLPRGALVRYREWYGAAAPNVGLKMTAEAVGAGIVERELNDPTLRYGVLDPACFKEDGGPSLAERINKVLIASAPAPIPRRRQFARPAARVDGRLGSAALPPSRPRWPAHDLLLQHTRCEHSERSRPSSTIRRGPRMLTPSPRTTPRTSGAMRACLGRSCGCPWHASPLVSGVVLGLGVHVLGPRRDRVGGPGSF